MYSQSPHPFLRFQMDRVPSPDPTTHFESSLIDAIESSSSSWSSDTHKGDGLFTRMSMADKCPSPLHQLSDSFSRSDSRCAYQLSLVVEIDKVGDVVEML